MLRENESKFQTLRVSVPRQIRENIWKNKKSKEMKLSMENEINIIFGVDPSSGLTMVKEVISTDVSSPGIPIPDWLKRFLAEDKTKY